MPKPSQKTDPEKSPERPSVDALLVRAETVAGMLDIGERTLWRWVSERKFPQPDLRLNERVVRWKKSSVMAWIEGKTIPH